MQPYRAAAFISYLYNIYEPVKIKINPHWLILCCVFGYHSCKQSTKLFYQSALHHGQVTGIKVIVFIEICRFPVFQLRIRNRKQPLFYITASVILHALSLFTSPFIT